MTLTGLTPSWAQDVSGVKEQGTSTGLMPEQRTQGAWTGAQAMDPMSADAINRQTLEDLEEDGEQPQIAQPKTVFEAPKPVLPAALPEVSVPKVQTATPAVSPAENLASSSVPAPQPQTGVVVSPPANVVLPQLPPVLQLEGSATLEGPKSEIAGGVQDAGANAASSGIAAPVEAIPEPGPIAVEPTENFFSEIFSNLFGDDVGDGLTSDAASAVRANAPEEPQPAVPVPLEEAPEPKTIPDDWTKIEPLLPQSIKDAIRDGWLTKQAVSDIFKKANAKWEAIKKRRFVDGPNENAHLFDMLKALGIKPDDAQKLSLTDFMSLLRGKLAGADDAKKQLVGTFIYNFLYDTITYKLNSWVPHDAIDSHGNCVAMSILFFLFAQTAGVDNVRLANLPPKDPKGKEGGHALLTVLQKDGKRLYIDLTKAYKDYVAIEELDLENPEAMENDLGWNRAHAWIVHWQAVDAYNTAAKNRDYRYMYGDAMVLLKELEKIDPAFFKRADVQNLLKKASDNFKSYIDSEK